MCPSSTPLLRGSILAFIAFAAIAYTASGSRVIAHGDDVTGGMVLRAPGFVAQVVRGTAASRYYNDAQLILAPLAGLALAGWRSNRQRIAWVIAGIAPLDESRA